MKYSNLEKSVSAGIYLNQVKTHSNIKTNKMILLK